MWPMVPLSNSQILRSTPTSPLSKLPTVWSAAPSWIHNSNPKPFLWVPIHISNGLLNSLTSLSSKDYAFNTLQPNSPISPPDFLLFLSSWFLLCNRHSQRGGRAAESAAFSACTQHYEHASVKVPITADCNHLARYLDWKFCQSSVWPLC